MRKIIGSVLSLSIAVTGLTLAATPAQAADPVCNTFCDARDPAQSTGERASVTAALFGREFVVHIDSGKQMAWASIAKGRGGDEVWIDRSFTAGKSWDGPLGKTAIPAGGTSWRTGMYNVDDWNTAGVGAVRACGKAGDRPEIACTSWTRTTWNADNRRTAAATALMMRFDRGTGQFDGNGWWTGANALTSLIDLSLKTGFGSYDYAIASTYDKNVGKGQGQFRTPFLDDTGWWGLAWVAAYDRTGDRRYLDTARADADHMASYWDNTCGGGVWWNANRGYKNAITNSLYIQLNAALSKRINGDSTYRQRAEAGWSWFQKSGMINGSNLVNDGLNTQTCKNNGDVTWTYNQGVLLHALVELNAITGSQGQLDQARRTGDAMVNTLSPNGILREPGEGDSCTSDGASFKGAAIRGLGALNTATGGAYNDYLRRNADSAYANDRDSLDQYGNHWAGPFTGTAHGCQHGALDLLNAAP